MGHRAAATALAAKLQPLTTHTVRIINLYQEVIPDSGEKLYNWILRKGLSQLYWPWLANLFAFKLKLLRLWRRRKLKHYWREHPPEMVVSLVPFINMFLHKTLKQQRPHCPFAILINDYAEVEAGFLNRSHPFWLSDCDVLLLSLIHI